MLDSPEVLTTVCVPERRRVVAPAGVRVVRRRRLAAHAHPVALPRRLRLEEALLDVTDRAIDEGEVIDLVLRAASSRRTCAERVRQALARRARHRHRTLMGELLAEAVEGVQSALERRYRRGVERAHGLPRGERNAPERSTGRTGAPRTRYRDIRYRRWRVVVELDGLEAHPAWLLRRDRARDNSAALDGDGRGGPDAVEPGLAGHPSAVRRRLPRRRPARRSPDRRARAKQRSHRGGLTVDLQVDLPR